jgi:hypothetical protein
MATHDKPIPQLSHELRKAVGRTLKEATFTAEAKICAKQLLGGHQGGCDGDL